MRLIGSKTLSKVFSEVLIHTNYLNESINLSLNVTGTFHVYLGKMNPQMDSAETNVGQQRGYSACITDLVGFHAILMRTSDYH